ncbi:MAG: acetoin dehydrogenase dihydrolipoyllysine-residue acetyltransferase subunit [Pseudomonadota bacterium]
MAEEVILPRVDMDMSEGKIAHWYVKNGDSVTKGQLIFEIETDKATMEIDASADGVIQGIEGTLGVMMPVGQVVAWILKPGESVPVAGGPALAMAEDTAQAEAAEAAEAAETAPALETVEREGHATGTRQLGEQGDARVLRATPLARSLGRTHGIDLKGLKGSGPDGRILASDVPVTAKPSSTVGRAPVARTGPDLNLHWYEKREGAPVLLLHGFGTSRVSWRPLAQLLGGLPLAALDLPGHGKSPRIAQPDFSSIADAVIDRLDTEGIDALHLVGHSMGGGVALAMAERLAHRLGSLTLIAPAGLGPEINGAFTQGILSARREESLAPWLRQLFADESRVTASFTATAWQELDSEERRAALAELADRLFPDGTQVTRLRANLDGLPMPVKVIWGVLDKIVPLHQSQDLPGHVAVHRVAGAGHMPQVEATELVARLIREQVAAAAAMQLT